MLLLKVHIIGNTWRVSSDASAFWCPVSNTDGDKKSRKRGIARRGGLDQGMGEMGNANSNQIGTRQEGANPPSLPEAQAY